MKIPELAEIYLPHIEDVISRSEGLEYTELHRSPDPAAISALPRDQVPAAFQGIQATYVLGILERAHLATITSLARQQRWLSGALEMSRQKNALAFSACLRGFLESAADSHDVLQYLPTELSRSCGYFLAALDASPAVDQMAVAFGELEGKLIHFAYAARRPKSGPVLPFHEVKSTTDYIRMLEKADVPGLEGLYAHLCELTHPAGASVACFLQQEPTKLIFSTSRDRDIIQGLMNNYEATIQELVSRAFNAPILCLSMLSRIIPPWPALPDPMAYSIGNFREYLEAMDSKLAVVRSGVVSREQLLAMLRC